MVRPLLPVLLLCAGPAAADPVALGRTIFQDNCQECHGPTASEGRSGDIRGTPAADVAFAVRGFEEMPEFDLTKDEIAAIAAYLADLKGH